METKLSPPTTSRNHTVNATLTFADKVSSRVHLFHVLAEFSQAMADMLVYDHFPLHALPSSFQPIAVHTLPVRCRPFFASVSPLRTSPAIQRLRGKPSHIDETFSN